MTNNIDLTIFYQNDNTQNIHPQPFLQRKGVFSYTIPESLYTQNIHPYTHRLAHSILWRLQMKGTRKFIIQKEKHQQKLPFNQPKSTFTPSSNLSDFIDSRFC